MCRASCIPGGWRTRPDQTSQEVEEQLWGELKAIETLLKTHGLPRKTATWPRSKGSLPALQPWSMGGGRQDDKM